MKFLMLSLISLASFVWLSPAFPQEVPRRIVCLAPGFSETLLNLGLRDRIVGVTTSSDYLEEIKDVKRVGLYMKPNLERIVSLSPDLVLAPGYIGQDIITRNLRRLGIRIEIFQDRGVEEMFQMVRKIGEICEVQKEGERLTRSMQRSIEEIRGKTSSLKKPRVYIETGYNPLFTAGQGTYINDLIGYAGGKNIAKDISKPYPRISAEFVIKSDPEIIILTSMGRDYGKEALRKRSGWRNISALRNNRVYDDLGPQIISIPCPRLILEGLPELAKRIHPEVFEDKEELE